MKTISKLFDEAWEKKKIRGWKYVYIMVDLHGVILPSNYHSENELTFINPLARKCLRILSEMKDVILILWTSSHKHEVFRVKEWLKGHGTVFELINENPYEANTDYADFSTKPYFSICLDDKAGFDASQDWEELSNWLIVNGKNEPPLDFL